MNDSKRHSLKHPSKDVNLVIGDMSEKVGAVSSYKVRGNNDQRSQNERGRHLAVMTRLLEQQNSNTIFTQILDIYTHGGHLIV